MFQCICFNPHEMWERKKGGKRKRRKGVLPIHGAMAMFHFFLLLLVVIAIISLQIVQKKIDFETQVYWSESVSIPACQTRPVFYVFNCNHTCAIRLWDSRVNLRTHSIRSTDPVSNSGIPLQNWKCALHAYFPSIASGVCVCEVSFAPDAERSRISFCCTCFSSQLPFVQWQFSSSYLSTTRMSLALATLARAHSSTSSLLHLQLVSNGNKFYFSDTHSTTFF